MKPLRMPQVMQMTGLSRMTLYRLELAGHFPKRCRLAENSVAWFESDISQWIESRPVAPLHGTGRDVSEAPLATHPSDPLLVPARRGRNGSPGEVFRAFLTLGVSAFGGPVAHIGYFHNEFVLRRRWLRPHTPIWPRCASFSSSQVCLPIGLPSPSE